MKSFAEFLNEQSITDDQLKNLEKFADRLLDKFGVDIEFTKHFGERVNDARNKPAITVAELQQFFKKIQKKKASRIKSAGDQQAVLKDIQKDLNLPAVFEINKDNEIVVTLKTIMRKKDFKSPDRVIEY